MRALALGLGLAGTLLAAQPAMAYTIGFEGLTETSAINTEIGETQFFMDLVELEGPFTMFSFRNAGPAASAIKNIYFEDDGGYLVLISAIDNLPGVHFSRRTMPRELPGGELIAFEKDYGAGTRRAVERGEPEAPGIDPGEQLDVIFQLEKDVLFGDLIDGLHDNGLRIGIHVDGFAAGGEESFVAAPMPEPSAVILFAAGLGTTALALRRRRS
jgi:hypothetical protein